MDHTHDEFGNVVYAAPAETEPAVAEVEAVEVAADADVEIARIQADTEVKLAKEATKREELWQESRVAELEGQMRGMREMLEKLIPEPEPEPEPAPVVITDPEPEAPIVDAPPAVEQPTRAGKKKGGMFSWPS